MLCQECKQRQATTHVKTIINGQVSEQVLCSECAKKLGVDNMFSSMSSDFNSFLGSFLTGGLPSRSTAARCGGCGSSFGDIARTGKVGCAECYDEFFDELLPTIRRIHGNTEHIGKSGIEYKKIEDPVVSPLEQAEVDLKKAIEMQEFEKAAELRDKIKELKGEEKK